LEGCFAFLNFVTVEGMEEDYQVLVGNERRRKTIRFLLFGIKRWRKTIRYPLLREQKVEPSREPNAEPFHDLPTLEQYR
jgi:hypothetical protein